MSLFTLEAKTIMTHTSKENYLRIISLIDILLKKLTS